MFVGGWVDGWPGVGGFVGVTERERERVGVLL